MKLGIGLGLFILGAGAAAIVYVFNGSTPMQLGPIPFFGASAVSLVGLVLFLSAL